MQPTLAAIEVEEFDVEESLHLSGLSIDKISQLIRYRQAVSGLCTKLAFGASSLAEKAATLFTNGNSSDHQKFWLLLHVSNSDDCATLQPPAVKSEVLAAVAKFIFDHVVDPRTTEERMFGIELLFNMRKNDFLMKILAGRNYRPRLDKHLKTLAEQHKDKPLQSRHKEMAAIASAALFNAVDQTATLSRLDFEKLKQGIAPLSAREAERLIRQAYTNPTEPGCIPH